MIIFLISLLVNWGQALTLPGFQRAECTVPSDHNPLVLSEVDFSIKCMTVLDTDSSLSEMMITVRSNLDGVIFNRTFDETIWSSNRMLNYRNDNIEGFSLKGLAVNSQGGHWLTVSISQRTVEHISGNETNLVIESESPAKCIHGFASVLPPIVVLLVCVATRQVTIALPFSIWFGAWLLDPDWNPVTSFERVWDTYYVEAIADVGHAFGICFAVFLGGLVKVIEVTGGTRGIAELIARRVKSSRNAALGVFAVGLTIFFDDYADCLIVGYTFMPLMDQYMVSREKFSFIVDSTAAPIASIAPLSSWVAFEITLIADYFCNADVWADDEQPGEYISFLKTIPYRFYPIFMLWFMFYTLYFQYDFGPMLSAEKRVKLTGLVSRPERCKSEELRSNLTGQSPNSNTPDQAVLKDRVAEMEEYEPRPLNALLPILTVFCVTLLSYILTGINTCRLKELEYSPKNIFSQGNSYGALLWAIVSGNVVAFVMALCQKKVSKTGERVKLITVTELFASFFEGVGVLVHPLFGILIFAWSMNGIVTDLRLSDYMITSVGDSVDIRMLPFVSCIISGFISLVIGSSWATMTVMFPFVVPLALYVTENNQEATIAVMGTILAGSVWGDHCSPISDTTILSSMASGCDHNDHVATQLPYACFVVFFSSIFGDLCVGYMGFEYPYVGILVGITLMMTCTFFIATKVPSYIPDGSKIDESCFEESIVRKYSKKLGICSTKADNVAKERVLKFGASVEL